MAAQKGKVAIVTGSATGLGAAAAVQLADLGWNIVVNYTRSKKEADETMAAVKARGVSATARWGCVAPHSREGSRGLQPARLPWRPNPFVLVNYSPTICLNPCP